MSDLVQKVPHAAYGGSTRWRDVTSVCATGKVRWRDLEDIKHVPALWTRGMSGLDPRPARLAVTFYRCQPEVRVQSGPGGDRDEMTVRLSLNSTTARRSPAIASRRRGRICSWLTLPATQWTYTAEPFNLTLPQGIPPRRMEVGLRTARSGVVYVTSSVIIHHSPHQVLYIDDDGLIRQREL